MGTLAGVAVKNIPNDFWNVRVPCTCNEHTHWVCIKRGLDSTVHCLVCGGVIKTERIKEMIITEQEVME